MSSDPRDGVDVHLVWGAVEWGMTMFATALSAGFWWVVRLGRRVDRLEAKVAELPDRDFMERQTGKVEERIDRLYARDFRPGWDEKR